MKITEQALTVTKMKKELKDKGIEVKPDSRTLINGQQTWKVDGVNMTKKQLLNFYLFGDK